MSAKEPIVEDIATQKINELRERAKKDFSSDEIQNFITMGKQLSGKTVIYALIEVIGEGPQNGFGAEESKRLIKKLTKIIPYNYSGCVSCAFTETPLVLNITLSLVNRDYKTDIDIPSPAYANDLFTKYNFLKNTAIAYWRQFAEEHPELYKRICAYRSDIDFSNLTVDKTNPTTLYFDPACKKRIGIFCYYVTERGQPFYKKTTN